MGRFDKKPAGQLFLLAFLLFQFVFTVAHGADKIRLAVPDVGGQFITFPLAQSRGFLKQEGIDAEIVLIRGNAALAAITGGDIDSTVGIPKGVRGALAMDGFALVVRDTKELVNVSRDPPLSELFDSALLRQAQGELGLKVK